MTKGMRVVTPWMVGLTLTGLLVTGCGTGRGGNGNLTVAAAHGTGTQSGSTTGTTGTSSAGNASGSGSNSSGSASSNETGTYPGWPKAGAWIPVQVKNVGQLPQGILGNALAMGPSGSPISVGGYTGQVSITNIYSLLPRVSSVANLPVRTHDAATGFIGNTLYVYGGGQATSYNSVVAVENGSAKTVATLSRPLSDAVSVPLTVDGQKGLALVGGYDGSVFRTGVVFMTVTGTPTTGTGGGSSVGVPSGGRVWKPLFNLKTPVRYAAVTSTSNSLYIAGGLKEQGLSNNVYAWSASTKQLHTITALSAGFQKAALFVAGPYLILIGGEAAGGVPMSRILEIDTRTGKSKAAGNFPTPIADMGYTQTASRGYLAGGVTTVSGEGAARSVYEITWQK